MPMLTGLTGVKKKEVDAVGVRSRTAAVRAMRDGAKAVTAASDNGAINVWMADDGVIHCEFMRLMATKGVLLTNSFAAVGRWLKKWWPEMG